MIPIKTILEQRYLTFYSAIAAVIILPVYMHFLPPVMIFWGLAWLFENKFSFNRKMFVQNKAAVLFILFLVLYLWQIICLFWADSLDSGFERIFKRLSFLLFPLVLFYPGDRIRNNIKLVIRIFALATLGYVVYCLGNAFYESLNLTNGIWTFNPHPPIYEWENYFYSYRLSEPVHPSYMAMYVVLSIIISLDAIFDRSPKILRQILWAIGIVVLFIVLYLLSSRAGFIAGSFAIIFYILYRLLKLLPKILAFVAVILLAVSLIFIAKQNTRINYIFENISGENIGEKLEKDGRYAIWKSTISVINENLIFGVGTGDASGEIKNEFISQGYVDGFYDNLNAHNQYLEIFLENGIIGLIIFLSVLSYMIFLAINNDNVLIGLFVLIIMIFFVFETILNRLAGITFFPLFSFLLYYFKPEN